MRGSCSESEIDAMFVDNSKIVQKRISIKNSPSPYQSYRASNELRDKMIPLEKISHIDAAGPYGNSSLRS
jgi:hypothetical protein